MRQTSTHADRQKPPGAQRGNLLRRQCACGNHTMSGLECEGCRKGSHPVDASRRDFPAPGFGHDFSRARTHGDDRTRVHESAAAGLRGGFQFVPELPPRSSPARRPRASAHPAERQADWMGRQIGRRLESVAVVPGPISELVRDVTEPALGVSLEGVHLHVGAAAHDRVTREGALAIADGADVSFADGQFMPATSAGRALIGHELTHVAQQRAHHETAVQHFALALNYERLARDIEDAISGPGTDEEKIYRALTKLERDPDSVQQLEATYRRLFGEALMHALQGDLDREEMDFARGLMGRSVAPGSKQRVDLVAPTTPAEWDMLARRIKAAVEHGVFGGTDEEAIFAVLLPLAGDANKIAAIKEAYARITRGPADALVTRIRGEMSGSELRYALQLLAVTDQHADTRTRLTRDEVLAVRNELQPGTAVTPPPPPPAQAPGAPRPPLPPPARWDGRTGAPGFAAKRTALASKLRTALTNHLTRAMPRIRAKAADPKLPMARVEGAANAAVEVTDDEYRSWYSVAATTPGQAALRSGFQFSQAAGNLLDATDPAARTAAGAPIDAAGQAHWMIRHDNPPTPPGAAEHMEAHDFDPDGTRDGESAWLQAHVIRPFVSDPTRAADLRLYDQFGFALQPEPGKIMLTTTVRGGSLAGGGTPNEADRRRLWSIWHIAVHEYLAQPRASGLRAESFRQQRGLHGVLHKAPPQEDCPGGPPEQRARAQGGRRLLQPSDDTDHRRAIPHAEVLRRRPRPRRERRQHRARRRQRHSIGVLPGPHRAAGHQFQDTPIRRLATGDLRPDARECAGGHCDRGRPRRQDRCVEARDSERQPGSERRGSAAIEGEAPRCSRASGRHHVHLHRRGRSR